MGSSEEGTSEKARDEMPSDETISFLVSDILEDGEVSRVIEGANRAIIIDGEANKRTSLIPRPTS